MIAAAVAREFARLPLDVIAPPATPSRAEIPDDSLDEITASIQAVGLIQPLIVARRADRYEIVAGYRRYLACRRAGHVVVECLVYATRDEALEAVQYAENRHREDLGPIDEAIWFVELLEAHCGHDTNRLAAFLNERRDYIEGRLLLLRADERVRAALQAGQIGVGVAQELQKVSDVTQCHYLLYQAIQGGATRAVVTAWVSEWKRRTEHLPPAPPPAASDALPGGMVTAPVFRCAVCHGTEHVHLMQPIQVHQHCQLAILDKLLASYRGEATT